MNLNFLRIIFSYSLEFTGKDEDKGPRPRLNWWLCSQIATKSCIEKSYH